MTSNTGSSSMAAGKKARLTRSTDNVSIDVSIVDTFWSRLVGLLGTKKLDKNRGLLIAPCSSIHTIGMKYSIDIIFLNEKYKVLKVVEQVQPFSASSHRGAKRVLELAAGSVNRLKITSHDQFILETTHG